MKISFFLIVSIVFFLPSFAENLPSAGGSAEIPVSPSKNFSVDLDSPGTVERLRIYYLARKISLPDSGIIAIRYDIENEIALIITLNLNGILEKNEFALPREDYKKIKSEELGVGRPPAPTLQKKPASQKNQDGRTYFMTHTVVKTLSVYPISYATLFPQTEGSVLAGLTFLTTGGTLYASYAFTKNRELGYGRVGLMNYGGDLGITYPALLATLLKNATAIDTSDDPDDNHPAPTGQIRAWGMMFGFPLGIYLGSKFHFTGNDEYGNISIMKDFSRFAWLYGYLLPQVGSGGDEKDYFAAASSLTMALIPTGFCLGYRIARDTSYSSGRSFLITTVAAMGTLTGMLLPQLFFEKDSFDLEKISHRRFWVASSLTGHLLGTYFGFKLWPERSYSLSQGVFMALSAAAGTALSLSLPLIAQSEDARTYIIMGYFGAWGGLFWGEKLARNIFEFSERDKRSSFNLEFPGLWQKIMAGGFLKLKQKELSHQALPLVQCSITL